MQPTSWETSSAPSTGSNGGRERRPGAAITVWLAVAAIQVALGIGAILVRDRDAPREGLYEYGNAIGTGAVFLVMLGLTIWIASLAGGVRETLGLRSFAGRWVWIAIGIVVLGGLLAALINWLFGIDAGAEQGILPDEWRPERAGAIAANGFVIVVVAPLVEELFFRGAGVRVLLAFGPAVAIGVTGLAFALAHGLLIGLVPLLLFGIGLAWVRLRSASVWPCVIAHALYNGAVLALGLACVANPECRQQLGCVI